MSKLREALDKRFVDFSEVKKIAEDGCVEGIEGFVYFSETKKFFFEYQNDIEEELEAIFHEDWLRELVHDEMDGITELINDCVWKVIESYCEQRVEDEEED